MLRCAVTGGPCGGKTEIMSRLTQRLEERGYKVFIVPETATELILNGIVPGDVISLNDFQDFVMQKQLSKESLYDKAASYYGDKSVIFYDRGLLDNRAYVDDAVFFDLLSAYGMTMQDAYNHYDTVLHMVTAADGAEAFYQWNDPSKDDVGNNAARSESPEEAREKDKKTLQAWVGHPHLRVFDNSTDFEGKIDRVVKEVFSALGEPIPKEIERKFLIKKPTLEEIQKLGCISETNIVQTYLRSENPGTECRVRQRGTEKDGYSFYYTEKTPVKHGERIEREDRITKDEYLARLALADTSLHQIVKTRNCFIYENQYFEMDTYPFSDEFAILEVEVNDIDEKIMLPPLQIVREVTGEAAYSNYGLARTQVLSDVPKTGRAERVAQADALCDGVTSDVMCEIGI